MKIKDYWRLAKISINARLKATRSTIRGISFSLIIIVPLVFAMLGISQSITGELNKNPGQLYANFQSAEAGSNIEEFALGSEENYRNPQMDNMEVFGDHSPVLDTIDALHYSRRIKNYNYDVSNRRLFERLEIGENKYDIATDEEVNESGNGYSTSTLAVIKNETETANAKMKKYLLDGFDKGFYDNGARQIILSERYVRFAGLKPKDVYGKKVSMYFRDSGKIIVNTGTGDSEYPLLSHYLFRDFEVVGIIKDNKFDKKDIRNANFVVLGTSYYNSQGKAVLAPGMDVDPINLIRNHYVGNYIEKNEKATEYIFPGCEIYSDRYFIFKQNDRGFKTVEDNIYLVENNDYKRLEKILKKVAPSYNTIFTRNDEFDEGYYVTIMASTTFSTYQLISKIFGYMSLFGGIVAGVILFAALINLFNTVKHSVDSRRHYLGVMKAIGAKNVTIPMLYFFEVMRILLRAFINILIFGTLLCIVVIIVIKKITEGLPFAVTLAWANIPLVLGLLLALLLVVGLLYAFLCSASVAKKPITELLED